MNDMFCFMDDFVCDGVLVFCFGVFVEKGQIRDHFFREQLHLLISKTMLLIQQVELEFKLFFNNTMFQIGGRSMLKISAAEKILLDSFLVSVLGEFQFDVYGSRRFCEADNIILFWQSHF